MDKLKVWLLFWLLLLVWGSSMNTALATESLIKWQLQSEEPSYSSEETKETTSSESNTQESEQTSKNESTNQAKLPQTSSVSTNKSISLWGMILITVSCYVPFERKRILKNEEKNS